MQPFNMRALVLLSAVLACPVWAGTFITALNADETLPAMTPPAAQSVSDDSATIAWNTDRPTDSRVYFDTVLPLIKVAGEIEYASAHTVKLTKLLADTTYLYQVVSVDPKGNKSTSAVYSFHTPLHATGTPLVTWPAPAMISYGTPLSAGQLNATANVPGSFTYTPASGAVLDAGTHTLSADFTPSDTYHYNPVLGSTATLKVDKADQTIDFPNPGGQYLGARPTLVASSSSGLAPAFSSTTGAICEITPSGKLSLYGLGTCTIQADQAGNGNYRAASYVRNSFSVLGATVPTARTTAATEIASTGATLNGNVNANGAEATVSFDYGLTTAYGVSTAATPAVLGPSAGSTVALAISGLSCNTAYHYQVRAVNSIGTTKGGDLSFATSACTSGVPGAPTIGTVMPGSGRVTVSFAAPGSDGGNAITGYAATCVATGHPARSGSGSGSPIVILGMRGGATYSCWVVATNAAGSGPASSARLVVPRIVGFSSILNLLLE